MKKVLFVGQARAIDHKAFILEDEPQIEIKKITDGFEALRFVLTSEKPDLVIMDLLADKINGLHFCYITRKLFEMRSLKVIIFSEHSHRNNIIKGIQSGATDYIIDPCSDVLFKDRVLYHLYETSLTEEDNELGSLDDRDLFEWRYITAKRSGHIEKIFVERIHRTGNSEIKVIFRDLQKRDFSSITLENPTIEEFEKVKTIASGDVTRFVQPDDLKQDEILDFEEEEETEDVLIDDNFGARKLDVYKEIAPSDTVNKVTVRSEIERTEVKRDQILHYKELKKIASKNKELQVLLNIDREIGRNVNRHDCMYKVVEQISSFIEMSRASIIVPSGDKKLGTVIVANDDRSIENLKIELVKYPEILKCLESGEIVFIEDVDNSEILKGVISRFKHLEYLSIVIIPIWHNNKIIAVLSIRGLKGSRQISYEDVAFCQIIANSTAQTVAGKIFLQKIMSKFIPGTR